MEEVLTAAHLTILKALIDAADSRNLPLYLVGGFVRDLFTDHANLDLDLTVEGDALSFAEEIATEQSIGIKRYPEFQTATLLFRKKIRVDLATARRETYEAAAELPRVKTSTIRTDLRRRDFTINSMALALNRSQYGKLVDPSKGLIDLKDGIIRVHHDRSFVDDPTRVFRAVRFETRYDFQIEKHTLRLIREAIRSGLIEKLTPARIKNEFVHLLEDSEPATALLRLEQLGVLRRIHRRMTLKNSRPLLEKMQSHARSEGVRDWFLLALPIFCELKLVHSLEIAKRLSFTRRETESLIKLHTVKERIARFPKSPSGVYRFATGLPKELIVFFIETADDVRVSDGLRRYLTEYRFVKLEVNGNDLEQLGVKHGPLYKEILDLTLDAKLDRGFHTREDELTFIKEHLGIER